MKPKRVGKAKISPGMKNRVSFVFFPFDRLIARQIRGGEPQKRRNRYFFIRHVPPINEYFMN